MKPLKLGLDLDGVFANFNDRFMQQILTTIGTDRRPSPDWTPTTWNWMADLGYTKREIEAVWAAVDANPLWWAYLDALPDAVHALTEISFRAAERTIVPVFMTTRHSPTAHWQSVEWVHARFMGGVAPQVCICANAESKGLMAKALGLDIVIDDYAPNLLAIKRHAPETRVVLFDQPWNAAPLDRAGLRALGYESVSNLVEFLRLIDETLKARG
jgi:hypothetical protein